MGPDQSLIVASGAAPIQKQTLEYFMSLNLPIREFYGMSETSGESLFSQRIRQLTGHEGILFLPYVEIFPELFAGPHTMNTQKPGMYRFGSVGIKIPGTELKLLNVDEDGNGEILMYGRNCFMGYMNNKEATEETIDKEGYVHSGMCIVNLMNMK